MHLISIIVPVYNVEKYLRRCLDSICRQSYQNIEIILIDDGSTDGSSTICDEYKQKDSRINTRHQDNAGLSAARNRGIDLAKGDYIAFIDSDDWVDENYISHMYELLVKKESDIVVCSYYCVDREFPVLLPLLSENVEVIGKEEAILRCTDIKINEKYNVSWNKLYKKELFDDIRYPIGKIHEDEFTSYKLFYTAKRITVTDKCLYYYFIRSDSIMNSKFSYKNLSKLEAYWERVHLLKQWKMDVAYVNMLFILHWVLRRYEKLSRECGTIDEKTILEINNQIQKIVPKIVQCDLCQEERKCNALYQYLTKEEVEKLRWKRPLSAMEKNDFKFPFDKVRNDSSIILYGAGVMGKQFFQQIIDNKHTEVNVVAWVDASWHRASSELYKIEPIDRILSETFDCVIIAINNEKISNGIVNSLIEWGVEENKIIQVNL